MIPSQFWYWKIDLIRSLFTAHSTWLGKRLYREEQSDYGYKECEQTGELGHKSYSIDGRYRVRRFEELPLSSSRYQNDLRRIDHRCNVYVNTL